MTSVKLVLGAVDYIIIGSVLAISAAIGVYFQVTSKKKNNEEYLLAGKDMSILPVSFSLMASFMSSVAIMGVPAEIYIYGTNMAFMVIGFGLGPIIATYVFLPVYFANDVSTAYEYLETRFGKALRRIASIMYAIQLSMYSSAILYAPALALSAVTNLSVWMSVIVIGVVCTFYCTLGGLKAVLWTDVFQTFLMYIAIAAIIVVGCLKVGGIYNVFLFANDGGRLIIPSVTFNMAKQYTLFNVLAQGLINATSGYGCSQISVQRLVTLKNLKRSKIASLCSVPMLVSFHVLCSLCGLVIYAYFRSCDPLTAPDPPIHAADQLVPFFITTSMSSTPGLPGLCIAGIFSASLSSISSAVNSLAAVTSEDLLKPLFPRWTQTVTCSKLLSVFYGLLFMALSYVIASIGTLIKINVIIIGLAAGPSLGIFLLGTCTKAANQLGTILGVLSSFVLGACLSFIPISKTDPYLPVVNEGCPSNGSAAMDLVSTISITSPPTSESPENGGFVLAYMWISTAALICTLVIGYLGSVIITFARGKPNEVKDSHLSPIRIWLSQSFSKKEKVDKIEKDISVENVSHQMNFMDVSLQSLNIRRLSKQNPGS